MSYSLVQKLQKTEQPKAAKLVPAPSNLEGTAELFSSAELAGEMLEQHNPGSRDFGCGQAPALQDSVMVHMTTNASDGGGDYHSQDRPQEADLTNEPSDMEEGFDGLHQALSGERPMSDDHAQPEVHLLRLARRAWCLCVQ